MAQRELVDVSHLMSTEALDDLRYELLVLENLGAYEQRVCDIMNRLVFYLGFLHGVSSPSRRIQLKEAYEKVIGSFADVQNQGADDHISYLAHLSSRLPRGLIVTLEPDKVPVCQWTEGSPVECQKKVNASAEDFTSSIRHIMIIVAKGLVARLPGKILARESMCGICLDEINAERDQYCVFGCSHAMHTTCVVELLNNDMMSRDGFKSDGPVCPECRTPLF
jgi:hypothetical protein